MTPPYHGKEERNTNEPYLNLYKMARQAKGMTQEQAAQRLHIDVRTLQNYEKRRIPPLETCTAMAELYEAPQLIVDHQSPAAAMGLFIKELEDANDLRREVIEIAHDNVISPSERERWGEICTKMQGAAMAYTALGSVR